MGLAAIKPIALELRHNDEVMGRVYAGAVDVANDDILCNADARFWAGLHGIKRRVPNWTAASRLKAQTPVLG